MKINKTKPEFFMAEAIKEAQKGIANNDGGPFGCVIVKDNKIIAKAHNEVIKNQDCTCHGEIQAIKKACKKLKTFDLSDCDLYTSGQPCPMCLGAIQWARIKNVYYACNYDDTADIGFDDKNFFESKVPQTQICHDDGLKLYDNYKKLTKKTHY